MSIKKVFFANCSLMSFLSVAILLMPAEIHAADATDGATLVKQNSCVACHGMDKKIVGPGFTDITAKYKGNADAMAMLTQKIKTGTSGTWGAVPMPAQAHVKDEDIKIMVSWILAGAK